MIPNSSSSVPRRGALGPRSVSNCRAPRIRTVPVIHPQHTVASVLYLLIPGKYATKTNARGRAAFKDFRTSLFEGRIWLPHGCPQLDWSWKSSCERKNDPEPGPLGGPRTRPGHTRRQTVARSREDIHITLQTEGILDHLSRPGRPADGLRFDRGFGHVAFAGWQAGPGHE